MGKAIVYCKNGLGNCVMLMPTIQALRDLTGQPVDVCIPDDWRDRRRPAVEDIYNAWDVVGKVMIHPKDAVDPREYEFWHYSGHNSGSRTSTMLFRRHMKHPPMPRPSWRGTLIHERDHYMEGAHMMGYDGPIPEVEFPIAAAPDLDKPELGLKRPYIGLCNGAFVTQEWDKKHWPWFGGLANIMRDYFEASVIGLGLAGELDGVPCDVDLCGKLPILETAKAIKQLDLFICTDTGLMHIADTMKVPMVVLFGPTLVSKNGPASPASRVVGSALDCAPCFDLARFRGCGRYLCMEAVAVGDVMAEVRKIIRISHEKSSITNCFLSAA